MSFLLISGFCFKSPGQAKNPEKKIRCSYESSQMKGITVRFLNFRAFPWGICIPRGNHNFTQQEVTWTWQAMQRWNKSYKEYIDRYKYKVLFPGKPEPEVFS